jgi:hypothetical protein
MGAFFFSLRRPGKKEASKGTGASWRAAPFSRARRVFLREITGGFLLPSKFQPFV